ncbi:MAG: DUF4476 domain-containing protein [Bacteroidia bacterium]
MLKRATITLLLLWGAMGIFAQNSSNLIIYSSGGEKFHVVLNGVRQNSQAETNVKITDLNAPNYEALIQFQNTALGEITKNLMMPESSSEVTMRVIKNKKGRYVLRYFSEVAINDAPPPSTGQYIIEYAAVPRPMAEPVEHTHSETTTTTTVTTTNGDDDEPMGSGGSLNVTIGGTSVGIDVDIKDADITVDADGNVVRTSSSSSSTTTTTTTTTTTSSSSGSHHDRYDDDVDVVNEPSQSYYDMPGYSGPRGCDWPMEDAAFNEAKSTIESQTFEDSKLRIAKQIIKSNCLRADQVRDFMKLFEYESTRLEFAKYAYNHTFDQGNYFKVNTAFEYESSIEELDEHVVN